MTAQSGRGRATFLAMMLVIAASWVLILVVTYLFFVVVRPVGPPLHESPLSFYVLKIVLTLGLTALLVFGMFAVSWLYLRVFLTPRQAS